MVGRPPLVAVHDGQTRELVRRETINDLLSRDTGWTNPTPQQPQHPSSGGWEALIHGE